MKTYEFTDYDRRLVVFACGCAIGKLREYYKYHQQNGEASEAIECLVEIEKHEKMIDRMKEGGPFPVE